MTCSIVTAIRPARTGTAGDTEPSLKTPEIAETPDRVIATRPYIAKSASYALKENH
jgi:hypothetical protein